MSLDTPRHIKYWERCYKSLLPHHYTTTDSSRVMLGCFIVAALDLLTKSSTQPLIPITDRARLREWVLSLQGSDGGFCGSPHHVLPDYVRFGFAREMETHNYANGENANIAATYFGLLILGIVAENDGLRAYQGVKRVKTLKWLKKLQRKDGSFGELVKEDGSVGGGRDMRYCYMVAASRWMLRGSEAGEDDIDVDALVSHIRRSQTFDGGIAESSMGESHSGYAYCAVAALAMLDRADKKSENQYLKKGIADIPALVHWLVARQFVYEDPEAAETNSHTEEVPNIGSLKINDSEDCITGFNGRLNKRADTCYAWWVSGTLQMLDSVLPGTAKTINREPARRFLFQETEHIIGGFGKHPGSPPDLYHSYLALAAFATMAGGEGEEGIGLFDVTLCVGKDAAARIEKARKVWDADDDDVVLGDELPRCEDGLIDLEKFKNSPDVPIPDNDE